MLKEVRVSTAQELVDAIAPDTKIIMEPGVYDITGIVSTSDYVKTIASVDASTGFEDTELLIENVSNLFIEGAAGPGETEIITRHRYATVFDFVSCKNITLKFLKLGHQVEKGDCLGGVLFLNDVNGLTIYGSTLYGSGTYGITAADCSNIMVTASKITECTYGAMVLSHCDAVRFSYTEFSNCQGYNQITITACARVSFSGCQFNWNDNTAGNGLYAEPYALLSCWDNLSKVHFRNCTFEGNRAGYFGDMLELEFENCSFIDNVFYYE